MVILYNLVFILVALAHLPMYILKGKFHRGFIQRAGFLPKACFAADRPVWVHAVSVGEAMAVRPLVEEVRRRFPQQRLIVSTVTSTGNTVARQCALERDTVVYLPWDLSWIVRGVLRRVRPSLLVIAETELWPNLISEASRQDIPVAVVNGRISDSSFRGYRRIGFLLAPVIRAVTVWCMQTETDAQRVLRLGAAPERVHITGNMKFDALSHVSVTDYSYLRRRLGVVEGERLFVAGSTHPGEDILLLKMYYALREQACGIKMLIAPRHPERAAQIARFAERYAFDGVLLSTIDAPVRSEFSRRTVFILDTVGELVAYYAAADVVFVGGSLVNKGGHNILEPAAFGKPLCFGPYMSNFKDIAALFTAEKAGAVVHNPEELKKLILQVASSSAETVSLGGNAHRLVRQHAGAAGRNVDILTKLLV